jgi:hypothetical protein
MAWELGNPPPRESQIEASGIRGRKFSRRLSFRPAVIPEFALCANSILRSRVRQGLTLVTGEAGHRSL